MTSADEPRPASIVVQRRIEWADTDASGWWHNTAGFRFIEAAETALLERLGILDDVYGRLPRASIAADFKRGLTFRDVVDCAISVRAVGASSITYAFELRNEGTVCMAAEIVAVLLDAESRPTDWPDEYRARLLGAGAQQPETLAVG
jgi:acyl-CoA thioester hydrolase